MAADNGRREVATQAKSGEVAGPLKEKRAKLLEAGLRAHYEAEQEVEGLKQQLDDGRLEIAQLNAQIAGLKRDLEHAQQDADHRVNAADSRAAGAVAERDRAVAERAAVEVILVAIKRTLDLARLPEPITDVGRRDRDGDAADEH